MPARFLFISDLHLSKQKPHLMQLFKRFMQEQAPYCAALYILGDLFEAVIGGDETSELYQQVVAMLATIAKQGIPIFFMHGNRDFLLNKHFAQQAHCTLLPERTVIKVSQQEILLEHGDLLCLHDINYQKYRKIVRHPLVQWLFLRLPRWLRMRIATGIRKESNHPHDDIDLSRYDAVPAEAIAQMKTHRVTTMIHGHTHRPALHQDIEDGISYTRVVLADWNEQGHYLEVLADGTFHAHSF